MNINLHMRYPESRQEDITDAFTRGYTEAVAASNNAIKKLEAENAKLRELVKAMTPFLCCMPFASCNTLAANVRKRMRELGIEVDE